MIHPEIIEKIRREKEERRPALELPLYPPEPIQPYGEIQPDEPEETTSRVIVIDL